MASSSSSARRRAGAAYVSSLELQGDSPEFRRHRECGLCNRRVVGNGCEMCLEMDGCRGSCDGSGCEVEVSGDDGWRCSLRALAVTARDPPSRPLALGNFLAELLTKTTTTPNPHSKEPSTGEQNSKPLEMAEDNSAAWPQVWRTPSSFLQFNTNSC